MSQDIPWSGEFFHLATGFIGYALVIAGTLIRIVSLSEIRGSSQYEEIKKKYVPSSWKDMLLTICVPISVIAVPFALSSSYGGLFFVLSFIFGVLLASPVTDICSSMVHPARQAITGYQLGSGGWVTPEMESKDEYKVAEVVRMTRTFFGMGLLFLTIWAVRQYTPIYPPGA